MFAAYCAAPPLKLAVPATRTSAPAAITCLAVVGVNAAIDFEIDFFAERVDGFAQAADFVELRGNESLPAKTGIDGHNKDEIEFGQISVRLPKGASPDLWRRPLFCPAP